MKEGYLETKQPAKSQAINEINDTDK